MQQLTIEDAEREWHIQRLDRSMAKWRVTGLDARLPDEYAQYCATLAHLRAGGAYVVRRLSEELIAELGRGICRTVQMKEVQRRKARREGRSTAL